MFPKYEMKRKETLETMQSVFSEEPDRLCMILRHSERHFDKIARREPFMGLTEKGKAECVKLGSSLGKAPVPRLFASHFGRCIETAYLLDKGYSMNHGMVNGNVTLSFDLTPFYITDIEKAINMVSDKGTEVFLRSWFNKEISEDIMLNPEETAHKIVGFMKKKLQNIDKNEVGIFSSHDWNIFPIKEFFFGLKHEEYGPVGYLDSVFLYEKNKSLFLTSYQKDPVKL